MTLCNSWTTRSSTRRSSWPSGTRRYGRRSRSSRPGASGCWPCSPATRRVRTRRSAPRCRSRWEASARSGPAAWNGCDDPVLCRGLARPTCTGRGASTVPDDEELLAALGEALRARREVPEWFVETGKNAYAWHDIDAELAQLTYDSLADREPAAAVRSEAASIRALTFTSARLSIEVEVGECVL